MLKKSQIPILIVNILILLAFAILSVQRKSYEFMIYFAVVVFFFVLILATMKRTNFSNGILWGLTLWAAMHMIGGLVEYRGGVIYGLVLVKLIENADLIVLRYDQLVHAIGFGVSTLVAFHLIKPYLNNKVNWTVLSVLVVLIGMGIGALNEIIEFITVVLLPQTGVGGYANTMLDICFNTIGAIIAVIYINIKRKVKNGK
ncbi:MAG: DUF2238 domain-containing protein [archaeon]